MQTRMNTVGTHKESAIANPSQLASDLSQWLCRVATDRDKQAFTKLFNFFAPKIKRFGMQKLNTEAMASELVQETMTLVWKKANLYHPEKGAATTWVYTLMRNACFDLLRKIKAKAEQPLADNLWPLEQPHDEISEEQSFQDHLLNKRMMQCVDQLPDAQQAVIKGVYFHELTHEQLAKQLGVPLGTIKSRLRLALAKLKQQMGDQHDD